MLGLSGNFGFTETLDAGGADVSLGGSETSLILSLETSIDVVDIWKILLASLFSILLGLDCLLIGLSDLM